jgi:hypothetical protein
MPPPAFAMAEFQPHPGWLVGRAALPDEESAGEAEARSARLAGADIGGSGSGGLSSRGLHHAPPPSQAFFVPPSPPPSSRARPAWREAVLAECELLGEWVCLAVMPARRSAPHALLFTVCNAALCTILLFWCAQQ